MSHKNKNSTEKYPANMYYPTPIEVIDSLIDILLPYNEYTYECNYFDIGSGKDTRWINKLIEKRGTLNPNKYYAVDLVLENERVDYVKHHLKLDILDNNDREVIKSQFSNMKKNVAFGNPPYFGRQVSKTKSMLEFFYKNFDLVAFLLPLDYTTGLYRKELYSAYGKPDIYNLVPRIDFTGQGGNDNNHSFVVLDKSKSDSSWYIYDWKEKSIL